MLVLKTEKIKEGLESIIEHKVITIEWNVDSTICVLIKQKEGKKYYEAKLPKEVTKNPVDKIVNFIYSEVIKEFK